jgi:V/A-type H+-transporting ATPase subunit D
MSGPELVPTRSAFLELKEERAGMREGYRFLDEKRLILAAEILAELARYGSERESFERDFREAGAALGEAVARHGVEGLSLYPPDPPIAGRLQLVPRSVLGVIVHDLDCRLAEPGPPADTALASPEAARCREAFRALIPRAARLAVMEGNLERLRADYARTSRRARALEDVLLPEIEDKLRTVDAALEELEREESVRARRASGDGRALNRN